MNIALMVLKILIQNEDQVDGSYWPTGTHIQNLKLLLNHAVPLLHAVLTEEIDQQTIKTHKLNIIQMAHDAFMSSNSHETKHWIL